MKKALLLGAVVLSLVAFVGCGASEEVAVEETTVVEAVEETTAEGETAAEETTVEGETAAEETTVEGETVVEETTEAVEETTVA